MFSTDPKVSELENHLSAGEQLLWSGKPHAGLMLRQGDWFLIPFTLIWCGGAISWTFGALSSNAPAFFYLISFFFLGVGLYITLGRFLLDIRRRRNTIYGITSERILIASGNNFSNLESLSIKNLQKIQLRKKSNGSGTIILGQDSPFQSANFSWPGVKMVPSLERIENVKEVYDQIINLQK